MSQTSPDTSRARNPREAGPPDTRQTVAVHQVLRRGFGALPALVRAVPAGDVVRASTVLARLRDLGESLHHHLTAEDELLWPLLLERVDLERPLVLRMEEQHERVSVLVERAAAQAAVFGRDASPTAREALAVTLASVAAALDQHLDDEEREVLPLVERHVSVAEWEALGQRSRGPGSRPDHW